MALVVGTNSYASVANADDYFIDRAARSDWNNHAEGFDPNEKAQALVTATGILDRLYYQGTRKESTGLNFPRVGYYFDQAANRRINLEDSTYPEILLHALYEQAYHVLANPAVLVDSDSVASLSVDTVELDRIFPAPLIPQLVYDILTPLLRDTNGGLTVRF